MTEHTDLASPDETANFKEGRNQAALEASSGTDENAPTLKMAERQDWPLFRTIEGLQQKAGVPAGQLRRLVLKELADHALDTGSRIKTGLVENITDDHHDVYFVAENGPGINSSPEEIAELFSIRRPMRSS